MKMTASTDQIQNMRKTFGATMGHSRSSAFDPASTRVKPILFERKTTQAKDFFGLSDGFKKLFTKDTKDQQIRVPIAGYGGHTRGDRSQNFFGKTWRECAL